MVAWDNRGHDAAWQRLMGGSPKTPTHDVGAARIAADQSAKRYAAVLEQHFRGKVTGWDVLIARVAWCQAESAWVDCRCLVAARS